MCATPSRLTHCVVCWLSFIAAPVWAQDAAAFRMEGVVSEEGTGLPVPDVEVQVLIESERAADRKIRSATTDASGRYSVMVPAGHGWAWNLLPPAGYLPVESYHLEQFATTIEQPVFRKNYQVRKGSAWPVTVHRPAETITSGKVFLSFSQQHFSTFCEVGDDGNGAVTIHSDAEGEFQIRCGDEGRALLAPDDMKVVVAKGFRTDSVISVNEAPDGGFELHDSEGRIATLQGVRAELKNGVASLVVELKARATAESGDVVGRVVDSLGKPLSGAKVEAAFHSEGGSAASSIEAISEADGAFRLSIPKPPHGKRVSLIVTKDGYAGLDTEPISLDFSQSPEADFGSIELRRSCFVRVRVVSPEGRPLYGAIVEPVRGYASRTQIARTGENGTCTLKNLAEGVEEISARLGKLSASTKLPLIEGDNKTFELKLSPPRSPTAVVAQQPATALKAGDVAPEWEIAAWTDGQARKLADYRGSVVVLDFWGIWCGPCISAIPAMKQLQEKYAERGVVFLGIHTAGTDFSLVKRLLKQQEWHTVTGLDVGDDIVSGKTVQSFGIRGFPSVVIIDRQGTLTYNTGAAHADPEEFMKEMEQLVKDAGLPWPIDEGATKEVIEERITKLSVLMHSREIDRALDAPAK